MKRLLAIEFKKLWKNKASRVLILAYFIILLSIVLVASIKIDIGIIHIDVAEIGIFNFPYIWHFNTYLAAYFKLFFAVVIVSMMANEYSYGTLKQNLIDGLSKKEFILSKFYTVGVFALGSTLFVFVMSLILGLSFSSYNEWDIIFSNLEYLLAYFVKLLGFFSLCLFVGILVKRSAFALGFLLLWQIVEFITLGLLRWNFYEGTDVYVQVGKFLPLQSLANLLVEPMTRLSAVHNIETQTTGIEIIRDYSVPVDGVIIVLVWTFIYIYASYKILQKRDL